MSTDDVSTDDHPAGRGGVLGSMCLALVLVVASVSSVNLALTGISVDLGATSAQMTWIVDGYTVALAALVLPFGALGDRFGRRTLLLVGAVVFGLAALAASVSGSADALISCRVAMGVGAAMIMPGTLSTITAAFPADERDRAVSVWAGFASAGGILGLLGCGLILEWGSWRAVFVATAILAAVAFVAALRLAPNTADRDEAVIDLPGSLLSALGIGALVYGIIDGAEAGWTAATAVGAFAVAAASLVGFVGWELRTERPMLDVRVFGRAGFSTGTLAITVQFLCLFGFFLVGLQYLQLILGYSPLRSALSLIPMAMIVMPVSRLSPHLVERFGPRAVGTAGLASLGVGLAVLSQLDGDSTYWHFLAGLVVIGLGMGLTSPTATAAIVSGLPRAKQGVASAMNDVSRELGSALGIAILGSLFNRGYRSAVEGSVTALPTPAGQAVEHSAGAGLAVAHRMGADGNGLALAVRDAFTAGLADAMVAGAVIAGLAALVTCVWMPRRAATASALDEMTEHEPSAADGALVA